LEAFDERLGDLRHDRIAVAPQESHSAGNPMSQRQAAAVMMAMMASVSMAMVPWLVLLVCSLHLERIWGRPKWIAQKSSGVVVCLADGSTSCVAPFGRSLPPSLFTEITEPDPAIRSKSG
jgi:hypothetical protein